MSLGRVIILIGAFMCALAAFGVGDSPDLFAGGVAVGLAGIAIGGATVGGREL